MAISQSSKRQKIRLNIRLDLAGGCSVGPGKVALLEGIAREGSLSEAARSLGMSYRRAWMLLDDLNKSFAESVATTAAGGSHGGGAVLTQFGADLIGQYRGFERDAERLAQRRLGKFEPRVRTSGRSELAARKARRAVRKRAK